MTQRFFVPGPLPGLNELIAAAKGAGGTGRAYSALKRTWTEAIWAYAKKARLQRMAGRVYFRFEWRENNRRRDPDNISSAGRKLVLDGLVKAGVIAGDGWAVVAGWEDRFVAFALNPGVHVILVDALSQPRRLRRSAEVEVSEQHAARAVVRRP